MIVLDIILYTILALVIHESAHFLQAHAVTKQKLKFRLINTPLPHLVWDMPDTTHRNQQLIAASGFTAELAIAAFSGQYLFLLVVAIHLYVYQMVADPDYNDFKWLTL